MTRKDFVRRGFDPAAPTALSVREAAELAALREADARDDVVDMSEIAPLEDAFWRAARPNPFFRPMKEQVTVRLDTDVLAWLRAGGRGYQTRLNDVLRAAMLREGKGAEPTSAGPAPAR